ncbi:hypothetical protein [Paenibacillus hexagrammi]|uniref:Uncharacterized protein n=1 Tax=Paenibacillus hexagrammi TaxID=2908839 RepID=A0ABY3SPX8_9BACL|nr:hypothetical protein [Paenibacillus sp. YPD9-1]UJF35897.1 hypothetical protein L0M14_12915 [Paenibacillus sp. YPD9-1]
MITVAWSVGLLCVKAELAEVEKHSFLDVFYKSKEGLHFEDVTSITMDNALGVGYLEPWTLIFDVHARFISNQQIALELSKKFKVKAFYISESLVFRDYHFGFIKKGGLKREVLGIAAGHNYLLSKGIKAIDEWGETIIMQIIESEILSNIEEDFIDTVWKLSFAKYELD